MIQILIAYPQHDWHQALRLLGLDLGAEASNWTTALSTAVATQPNRVVHAWDLPPLGSGHLPQMARSTCSSALFTR